MMTQKTKFKTALAFSLGLWIVFANPLWGEETKPAETTPTPLEQLIKAAGDGNIEQVKALLDEGVNVNAVYRFTTKTYKSFYEVGKIKGVDPEKFVEDYLKKKPHRTKEFFIPKNALSSAIQNKQPAMVKFLLENGADPNQLLSKDRSLIYLAHWTKQVEIIRLMLDHGARPDWTGEKGHTLLMHSLIFFRDYAPEIPLLYIQREAQLFSRSPEGNTALHLTVSRGNKDQNKIIEALLAKGLSLDTPNNKGQTSLHLEVLISKKDTVDFLLKKGANVNARDHLGRTPLHLAAKGNKPELLKLLIDAGAEINPIDILGKTPLELASPRPEFDPEKTKGRYNISWEYERKKEIEDPKRKEMQALLKIHGGKVLGDSRPETYRHKHFYMCPHLTKPFLPAPAIRKKLRLTPLHLAVLEENLVKVKSALKTTQNLNQKDYHQKTALHYASESGNPEIVSTLIENGGNPNVVDPSGRTPLILATRNCHEDAARLLLEQGALVNHQDNNKNSALTIAVEREHQGLIKMLLQSGGDLNTTTPYDNALILELVPFVELDLLKLILKKYPLESILKDYGILSRAARKGRLDIVRYLVDQGVSPRTGDFPPKEPQDPQYEYDTPLHYAALGGHLEVIKYLVAKGADVNATREKGAPPLYWAMHQAQLDATLYLIEQGAKVYEEKPDGENAFHWLSIMHHSEQTTPMWWRFENVGSIASVIFKKGANINGMNKAGQTPVHLAVDRGRGKVLKWLLEYGANPNIKNNDGNTPLHLVIENLFPFFFEALELLMQHGADPHIKNHDGKTFFQLIGNPSNWPLEYRMRLLKILKNHLPDSIEID